MYSELKKICERPALWAEYTAESLWTHPDTASGMLNFHLNPDLDVASRRKSTIDATVRWITERFGLDIALCDLGCGPGLYSNGLAEAGLRVTVVDFSRPSLAHARRRATRKSLTARYECANYLDWCPETRFDLVTLIMCDYCALSPAQRRQLLGNIRRYLKPGGHLLLDVYSIEAFAQRTQQCVVEHNQLNHFWAQDDYYAFVSSFVYPQERVSLDRYSLFEASGRERTIYNWLQYFCPVELRRELSDSGFVITEMLSDLTGKPYRPGSTEFAVVCQSG